MLPYTVRVHRPSAAYETTHEPEARVTRDGTVFFFYDAAKCVFARVWRRETALAWHDPAS